MIRTDLIVARWMVGLLAPHQTPLATFPFSNLGILLTTSITPDHTRGKRSDPLALDCQDRKMEWDGRLAQW
jgi:hypothetical protein